MCKNKDIMLIKENERLTARVQELENFFNNAAGLIVSVDQVGIIEECNNQVERMLGYDKNEFIGQPMSKFIHQNYIDKYKESLKEVLDTGFALDKEYKMIKQDGSLIDVSVSSSGINKSVEFYDKTICIISDISIRKAFEQQRIESEERYLALYESTPLAYQSLDEKAYFIDVNPVWLRTLGYKREEIIGKSFSDFLHDNWKEHFNVNFPKFKTQGYINDVQFKIRHKNGEYRDISFEGRIGSFQDGSFKQTYCVFQDITESKKAFEELAAANQQLEASNQQLTASEQQIKAYNQQLAANDQQLKAANLKLSTSETKLRKIIDYSPFPIAVVNALGNEILFWSKSATRLFGHTVSEMKEWFDLSYPDPKYRLKVRERWETHVEKALLTKLPINTGEYNITCKDGKVRICELYATFIENQLVVTFNDITNRKDFEEEILKAKEKAEDNEVKYKAAFYTSPDAVNINKMNGEYVEINEGFTRLTGYTKDDVIGRLSSEVEIWKIPEDRVKLSNALKEFGIIENLESVFKSKDGTLIPALMSAKTITLKNEPHILSVTREISERKEFEQELITAKEKAEDADRLKSAFLANMSHEIRTPMNGILGFTELLIQPDLTGEQQTEYISIIQKSGDRLLGTVNDIIEISRIETGLVNVNIDVVNINLQMQDLFNFFKPEAKSKGLKLILEDIVYDEEIILNTDSFKFNSILTNIIKNAIKYTNLGYVRIGYERKKDALVFCVSDSGIGIRQDRQSAVFERFIQADIEDRMAYQGSGLGLAIAKSFVEMLGGEIWLNSEEHKGSSFYFSLPLREANSIKLTEPTVEGLLKNETHKKIKVLIAEDNQISYLHLSIILRSFANEILHAQNGQLAIDLVKDNPDIELVLMDVQMPILDGIIAMSEIRKFNKEICIVAQTAYALEGDRDKFLESGFDDYIPKPIDVKKLRDIVLKVINKGY